VHTGRAPTRSSLTSALGVTRGTAGAIAAELRQLGLISIDTSPLVSSGRGRPSHRLAPAEDGPVVLAARVHAGGIEVALVGLGAVIAEPRLRLPLPRPAEPEPVLRVVAEAGARLVGGSARRCLGFGLSVPSPVTVPDRTALAAIYLDWPPNTPVGELFDHEVRRVGLELPRFIGNDANLSALAEHRHGAGRDARHLLYVMTGDRGVGGGLVVDGRLHQGSSGLAIEVGQLTVRQDDGARLCACGRRGCLDVEADPPALLAAAGVGAVDGQPVLEQAEALLRERGTEPRVREAVREVVDRLGLGIAGMVNLLNPDRVVLGALHADLLAAEPERLARVVAERAYWGRSGRIPIVAAQLGEPDLVGAAELAWQPVLDDPLTCA
jgi:predicted NBD/HSP70 family sugar kinase